MTQTVLSTDRLRTTPTILRAWSVGIVVLLALTAVAGAVTATTLVSSTNEIDDNTGPVLISTQGLVASVAEADAANTAVFLSGVNEDRQQRRLYETALDRAPRQIEDISARLGNDTSSHGALQSVASQLTVYSGTVERARLGNVTGVASATDDLQDALNLVGGSNGMLSNLDTITERTQERLDDDIAAATIPLIITLALAAVSLIALIIAQLRLRARTKRTFNPGLLLATFVLLAFAVWLLAAAAGRTLDLNEARDEGYDSIALTAELQTAAFDFKTDEAASIIGASSLTEADREAKAAEVAALLSQIQSSAGSAREVAGASELSTRWDRYLATSDEISARLTGGDVSAARTLAIGAGNRDFNGFNTTVEAVLLANRDQFDESVDSAANRLNWLLIGMIVLPIVAAALALAGYQSRINEYW